VPDATAVPVIGVLELERLAARSWRGLEEEHYGGWTLRAGGGFTGRANSVLIVGESPEPPEQAVATVTRWYEQRGLRPQASVPLPGGEHVDGVLERAGWSRLEDNLVLVAPLGAWDQPAVDVALVRAPDDAWLSGYHYRGTPLPPIAREIQVNAYDPVFASVRLDPPPAPLAAVARGARVADWLVVSAVTVDERYRRSGLATAVMSALGGWGRERGARACLLQVASSNTGALALYERLGFTEHHRYHYRMAPLPS
jgi:GNAT superfamily N-acetyltransferase